MDAELIQALRTLNANQSRSASLMAEATEELQRRKVTLDRQTLRIARLSVALQELEEIAEDKYDGPEDRTWGPILNIIRNALAG